MMFDKLKQINELKKLRAQAMKMKRELAQETVELVEGNVRVVVNGNQEVKEVEIDGEPQDKLKQVLNRAIRKAQQKAAAKMTQMSGGLGGLLGGK